MPEKHEIGKIEKVAKDINADRLKKYFLEFEKEGDIVLALKGTLLKTPGKNEELLENALCGKIIRYLEENSDTALLRQTIAQIVKFEKMSPEAFKKTQIELYEAFIPVRNALFEKFKAYLETSTGISTVIRDKAFSLAWKLYLPSLAELKLGKSSLERKNRRVIP